MKKYLFLILSIYGGSIAHAQSIVFHSISNSDTKLTESIELASPVAVVLENSRIETTKQIIVNAPLIKMSNVSIKCKNLIFQGTVNQVDAKDDVNIDCESILLMTSTAPPPAPALIFHRWNNAAGNLKISYKGTFTNSRNIVFGNADSMNIIFVKK